MIPLLTLKEWLCMFLVFHKYFMIKQFLTFYYILLFMRQIHNLLTIAFFFVNFSYKTRAEIYNCVHGTHAVYFNKVHIIQLNIRYYDK